MEQVCRLVVFLARARAYELCPLIPTAAVRTVSATREFRRFGDPQKNTVIYSIDLSYFGFSSMHNDLNLKKNFGDKNRAIQYTFVFISNLAKRF